MDRLYFNRLNSKIVIPWWIDLLQSPSQECWQGLIVCQFFGYIMLHNKRDVTDKIIVPNHLLNVNDKQAYSYWT